MAEIAKPKVAYCTNLLDFGYVTTGTTVVGRFIVESLSYEEVHWKIIEFTYDFLDKQLKEINKHSLSVESGIFNEYGQKAEVAYHVEARVIHTEIIYNA